MKNSKELFEELQGNIAVSNFGEKYTLKEKNYWRVYEMKKRIIAISMGAIMLASGVAFGFHGEEILSYMKGLGNGIDTAANNGYIEKTDMETMQQDTTVENNIIDNVKVGAKIDDFIMDDYNLSVKFDFEFDENIDKIINLENIKNIELSDLCVLDENNTMLYSASFNENATNSGLNSFIKVNSKELRKIELQYNMYADKYPKSRKLSFNFSKIEFQEMDKNKKTVLSGNWNINIDVPEKFYNRSEAYYKVVSSTNDNFNIYSAKLTDTGFEFGMTIKDEHKPTYPEAVKNERKNIIEQYGILNEDGLYTSESQKIMSQKINELSVTSPYKELLEEYEKKDTPILSRGLTLDVKSDIENGCYVMNNKGEKFECTMSPSRKCNYNFIDGDKYDFYETYSMTKYDATNDITMVVNYRGTLEYIKLQKVK
ncbi:MAG: hypothetical protein V8R51_05425 [Clostridia bacterium]